MSKSKKPITVSLNGKFHLQLCEETTEGALNGYRFEAKDEWCIVRDCGDRYSWDSRYTFSTIQTKEKRGYFPCGTAKAAIQQLLLSICKGKLLKETWFLIIETGKDAEKWMDEEEEEPEFEDD